MAGAYCRHIEDCLRCKYYCERSFVTCLPISLVITVCTGAIHILSWCMHFKYRNDSSKKRIIYLIEFSYKYFKLSLFNVYSNPIPLLPMQQGDRVVVTHRVVVPCHNSFWGLAGWAAWYSYCFVMPSYKLLTLLTCLSCFALAFI